MNSKSQFKGFIHSHVVSLIFKKPIRKQKEQESDCPTIVSWYDSIVSKKKILHILNE